ncbi:MAG: GNAT family N-acetyltransferase [Candidatus Hermodarchaeota archaeon]
MILLFMDLYFRKLKNSDIPQITEISNEIWEGEDYVPSVINNWLKQKDCLNYGAFDNIDKTNLIGFGRVKYYPNGVAWLEGGRVRPSYQQKGIGRQLIHYALTEAQKTGANIAQYDTSSKNQGSIALARYFGFKRKKEMQILSIEPSDLRLELKSVSDIKIERIDALKAKSLYSSMDIGPGNEICIGWSFIPLDFLSNKDFTWLKLHKSILHTPNTIVETIYEKPTEDELWMITYGEPLDNKKLIEYLLSSTIQTYQYKVIVAFCQLETANLIQKLGFRYENDEPSKVVLFEKKL